MSKKYPGGKKSRSKRNELPSGLQMVFMQAIQLHRQGRLMEAKQTYESILKGHPRHFESLNFVGLINAQTRNFQEAIRFFNKATAVNPGVASVFNNRGNVLKELGRLDEALASYDRALYLKPDYAEAYNNRGNVLQEQQCLDQALADYNRAVELKSDFSEAYNNRGNVLQKLERLEEALVSYDRAVELRPDNAEALNNRGNVLAGLDRLDEALVSYDAALALKPDFDVVYYNQGDVLVALKRFSEALACYDRALIIRPDYAEACNNRGNVLRDLDRLDEALDSYDRALKCRPDFAEACNNRGIVLTELNRLAEALASFDRALELRPNYAEAYNNRANVSKARNRLDEALADYDKALAIKPDYAQAHFNRAGVLVKCMRLDEALDSYVRALEIKPVNDFWWGAEIHTRMMMCQWTGLESRLDKLRRCIQDAEKVTPPFPVLALLDEPGLQKQAATIFSESECPEYLQVTDSKNLAWNEKIRIGYYSADFYNHATAYLMAELFERHDRNRFEIYGFSFGPDKRDDMRQRVTAAFDNFYEVGNLGDRDIAELSRKLGIDIAVDLKGHTNNARLGIFAARCAPVQVNYLGYPGTMGARFIDYIIADKTIIPEELQHYYTEKVVCLPHSYQVNDSQRRISEKIFTRRDFGLPESAFVYCCFNNCYKILPETFDIWMRLLQAIDRSVLWLLEDNPWAVANLREAAASRGIDSDRLFFAQRLPLDEHLARHRCADLFIDTLPCNAHTTASDALWAGLPVLTCAGESFAGRVAASLVNATGLPELVTYSQQDYEARALELAKNSEQLAAIKQKLQENRLHAPLFDTALFTKNIESAYQAMYERYRAGLAPESIVID